jgi:hypothetical protein
MSITDGILPGDAYGTKADGVYAPNGGVVALQGGPVTNDNQSPAQPSAPAVVCFSSTVAVPTPADSTALAGLMPSVNMMQTGTGLASPRRVATKAINLAAQAITAGTPVSVYTPTSGKKWRIMSYGISDTVAGAVKFEDTTGVEVFRTPLLLASTPYNSPDMGNGYLSTAANNQLFLDVTVTGNISGSIWIMEE